jgi:hypothetical protein
MKGRPALRYYLIKIALYGNNLGSQFGSLDLGHLLRRYAAAVSTVHLLTFLIMLGIVNHEAESSSEAASAKSFLVYHLPHFDRCQKCAVRELPGSTDVYKATEVQQDMPFFSS